MEGNEIVFQLSRMILGYLVPAMLGTLGVVGVLSASPFGRGVIEWLRGRRDETELLEAMLHELQQMRATLGETAERLDAMERRLLQERPAPLLPPALTDTALPPSERVATPH